MEEEDERLGFKCYLMVWYGFFWKVVRIDVYEVFVWWIVFLWYWVEFGGGGGLFF